MHRRRIEQLLAVFAVLDMEGTGVIGSDHLFQLGQMRRQVGQKTAEWTHQQNAKLLAVLDCEAHGSVSAEAFADYFERSLPRAQRPFEESIAQLMLVAYQCTEQPSASGPQVTTLGHRWHYTPTTPVDNTAPSPKVSCRLRAAFDAWLENRRFATFEEKLRAFEHGEYRMQRHIQSLSPPSSARCSMARAERPTGAAIKARLTQPTLEPEADGGDSEGYEEASAEYEDCVRILWVTLYQTMQSYQYGRADAPLAADPAPAAVDERKWVAVPAAVDEGKWVESLEHLAEEDLDDKLRHLSAHELAVLATDDFTQMNSLLAATQEAMLSSRGKQKKALKKKQQTIDEIVGRLAKESSRSHSRVATPTGSANVSRDTSRDTSPVRVLFGRSLPSRESNRSHCRARTPTGLANISRDASPVGGNDLPKDALIEDHEEADEYGDYMRIVWTTLVQTIKSYH